MKTIATAIFSLFGFIVSAQAANWPPLPNDGFIAGRAATKEDVDAGRAVFVAAVAGKVIGKPLSVAIPQYAWHKEGEKRTQVIVIQVEDANGKRIVGAKTLDGGYMAGFIEEFEMLGTKAPVSVLP